MLDLLYKSYHMEVVVVCLHQCFSICKAAVWSVDADPFTYLGTFLCRWLWDEISQLLRNVVTTKWLRPRDSVFCMHHLLWQFPLFFHATTNFLPRPSTRHIFYIHCFFILIHKWRFGFENTTHYKTPFNECTRAPCFQNGLAHFCLETDYSKQKFKCFE